MSAASAFRSPLMQQFAAAARTQSRPPLALVHQLNNSSRRVSYAGGSSSSSSRRADSSTRAATSADNNSTSANITASRLPRPTLEDGSISRRLSSTLAQSSSRQVSEEVDDVTAEVAEDESSSLPEQAQSFQHLIKTRRTISYFSPLGSSYDYRPAVDRAIECALASPNHHRTEPFTFKRMVSPSEATDRLADICYHVTVNKAKRKGSNRSADDDFKVAAAQQKRERWSQIPAFLVTLVGGQPPQQEAPQSGEEEDPQYTELPFTAPSTERQLEDYAAACAAIQNVLLSLHSEGIGSKWATGPVIRTSAFRELVGIQPDELVAGMIMIGIPNKKRIPKQAAPRRRRRAFYGDVLQDL